MKINKMFLGVALGASILMAGCGKSEVMEQETEEEVEPKSFDKLSDLIPNPEEYFHDTEFEYITDETSYNVFLECTSDEEFEEYILKCKEDGFWANESYRSDLAWYVYSEDGKFSLLLDRYGTEGEYMSIVVMGDCE